MENKKFKNKENRLLTGFTLIELIVVIAIITVLSGIVLFATTQYINKGKDSNISGNLAILIPAGEVFYNGNNNSYNDGLANFCDPVNSSVLKNIISQMPVNSLSSCYDVSSNKAGVCCHAESQAWAACALELSSPNTAYCVDSRGVKREVDTNSYPCTANMPTQCPD